MTKSLNYLWLILIFSAGRILAQPAPGEVFREYIWETPDFEKSEKFLRVSGRFDYRNEPEKFPRDSYRMDTSPSPSGSIWNRLSKPEYKLKKISVTKEQEDFQYSLMKAGGLNFRNRTAFPGLNGIICIIHILK